VTSQVVSNLDLPLKEERMNDKVDWSWMQIVPHYFSEDKHWWCHLSHWMDRKSSSTPFKDTGT